MVVAGFLHLVAFVYLGKMYRTKEEEMARRDRDDDIAMRGVWLVMAGTALCVAALVRLCL